METSSHSLKKGAIVIAICHHIKPSPARAATAEDSARFATMLRPEMVITEEQSRQLEEFAESGIEACPPTTTPFVVSEKVSRIIRAAGLKSLAADPPEPEDEIVEPISVAAT